MQAQSSQQKVEVQGELKLGEAQMRTLAPDAIHVWNLTLEKGQYVEVRIAQKSIDVIVRLVDAKGVRKTEINNADETMGKL
jgi:hypothetical protein